MAQHRSLQLPNSYGSLRYARWSPHYSGLPDPGAATNVLAALCVRGNNAQLPAQGAESY